MHSLLALGMPGATEWIIIGIIGLLFFGKRLPEVGRSLGKGIVEFKRGLKGIEDDIDVASSQPAPRTSQPAAPHRFDPYTGKPIEPTGTPPANQA